MNGDELKILELKNEKLNSLYNDFKSKNSIDDLKLKENINDILGQIEICIKRVNFNSMPKEYIKTISAFKYANNLKKHSNYIFEYTLRTVALYPSDDLYPSDNLYPSDFKIWWKELPYDGKDRNNEKQYKNYNKFLKGKELISSINEICRIIKLYYIHYF